MAFRSRLMAWTALIVACLAVAVSAVRAPARADDDEDERVEELMEKVHEGKRSPYRQLRAQVAAAAPAWPAVDATLPGFQAMARALLESRDADIKGSADGYVDAVKEVTAAAANRDPRSLKQALESLTESCGDCHFEGGVGGELDD